MPRRRSASPASPDASPDAAAAPSTLDGQEIAILDSIAAVLIPRATAGDEAAVDRVLSVFDLRLKYKRQRRVEEDD